MWDNNTGVVDQELTGVSTYFTQTSFEITEGIVEGNDYLFKVRALNIYGWSEFSDVVTIRASEVPQQPDIVTTSMVGTYVRITFQPPADNGEDITAYQVLIEQSDDQFSEHAADCDASTDPVLTNLYCDVPMNVLRGAPYNLVLGDLVRAKVKATNAVGDSDFSQENTGGVVVETVPGPMTSLSQDLTSQSLEWIVLTWDALTTQEETGGTAILNYRVRWNQGTTNVWVDLATVAAGPDPLSYTANGLTGGIYYQFTVQAENIHGWGYESSVFIENAAAPPDQPD